VLDLCAGLGGPARFVATRRGCHVVALELHEGRAAGAARLTRRVGLDTVVNVIRADARALPFANGSFDACISQEALLHIEDKAAVLAGCRGVLTSGGRLAFTDWIALRHLGDLERRQLTAWMAAVTLQTLDGYRDLLGRTGFGGVEAEDITEEWRGIVRTRVKTFRELRASYVPRVGETRYHAWEELYAFFVGLIEAGKLGGGRFTATR
jgi:sarcosine/dimethylglycine N-methyltransferase